MKILEYMPQPLNEATINKRDALNIDIRDTLESDFLKGVEQCKKLAPIFKGANELETAALIWNYLKKKCKYRRDPNHNQLIRLPSFFVHNKGIGDCKTFALFARSVFAALYPNNETAFRFAGYRDRPVPTHVYTMVKDASGKPIIIDGCWHSFNSEKNYKFALPLNYKAMNVTTLAGTEETVNGPLTPKQLAFLRKKLTPKQIFKLGLMSPKRRAAFLRRMLNAARNQKARHVLNLVNQRGSGFNRSRIKNALRLRNKLGLLKAKMDGGHIEKPMARLQIQRINDELESINGGKKKKKGPSKFKKWHRKQVAKLKKFNKKVGKGLKAIGRGIATATLAPIRGGFLSVVALNINGLATKLKLLLDLPDKTGWKKIVEIWKNVGGFEKILKKTIAHGAKKKKLFLSKKAKRRWEAMLKKIEKKKGVAGLAGICDTDVLGDAIYIGDIASDADYMADCINGEEGIGIAPAIIAAAIAAATGIIAAMIPVIMQALKNKHPEVAEQTAAEGQEIVDRTQGGAVYQQAYQNAGGQPTSLIPPPMQPEEGAQQEGGEASEGEEVSEGEEGEETEPYTEVRTAEEMVPTEEATMGYIGTLDPSIQQALMNSLSTVAQTGLQFAGAVVANKAKKKPKLARALQAAQTVGQGVVDNYMAQQYMQNAGFKPLPNVGRPIAKRKVTRSSGFNMDGKTIAIAAAALLGVVLLPKLMGGNK